MSTTRSTRSPRRHAQRRRGGHHAARAAEYHGRDAAARFRAAVTCRDGRTYRLLEARANGQPACGSYPAIMLTTELFPTSIRAAVAGWLVVAGVLGATSGLWVAGTMADALDSFAGSMVVVCVPGALAAVPFALLPESRGLDLERSAPEESSQLPTAG